MDFREKSREEKTGFREMKNRFSECMRKRMNSLEGVTNPACRLLITGLPVNGQQLESRKRLAENPNPVARIWTRET